MSARVAIRGNTYPVRNQLKELGGKWDAENRAWMVPSDRADEARKLVENAAKDAPRVPLPTKCRVCGVRASRYDKIYRSGECRDCFEERKSGY